MPHPSTFFYMSSAEDFSSSSATQLYPTAQQYQRRLKLRAELSNSIEQSRTPHDHSATIAGRASQSYNVMRRTFAQASRVADASPSKHADQGIPLVVLPSIERVPGGAFGSRVPNELDRSLSHSASLPGPLRYRPSDLFGTLKHGYRMVLPVNKASPPSLSPSPAEESILISNPDLDRASRTRITGGLMLGRAELSAASSYSSSTIGPADYQGAGGKLPRQVVPRIQGGTISVPLEDAPVLGPAPHDYQAPLKDRTPLVGGRMHPLHQSTGNGLDWWEMQRGPGKYGIPFLPRKNVPLGMVQPLPSTVSRIASKTLPLPGAAYYNPKDMLRSVRGVPFGALRDVRTFGLSSGGGGGGGVEGIPYLIPKIQQTSESTGFSFVSRTLTSDQREMIARSSEPGPQAYDALRGEPTVNIVAPRHTLGARPYVSEDFGPFRGPGPATYLPTSGSSGLFGAHRLSVLGTRSTTRFDTRASTLGMPRHEKCLSDVPAPDAYLLPTTNRGIGAFIGSGLKPDEDLQMSPREKEGLNLPGPGRFNPIVSNRGRGSTIGGRVKIYNKQKRAAVVRRARLAMMKSRARSASTWNG